MTVIQQREKCIGCGSCASLCPAYWHMDEDGKASLRGASFNPNKKEFFLKIKKIRCHREAMDACPVQCIKIN